MEAGWVACTEKKGELDSLEHQSIRGFTQGDAETDGSFKATSET